MKKTMTLLQRRRNAAAAAMSEVKKLVKRFSRAAVSNCLGKIAAWEREQKKLSKLRSEVAQLERRLKT